MKLRNGLIGLLVAAVAAASVGCGAEQSTLPPDQETPMPTFQYSWTGCTAWSCESGQCPRNPAIWGACCTAQNTNDPEISRPSCTNPAGPYVYCEAHPERCSNGTSFPGGSIPSACYGEEIWTVELGWHWSLTIEDVVINPYDHPQCFAQDD